MNAARTSSPTSKAWGPIQGPNQTQRSPTNASLVCPVSDCNAESVRATTPCRPCLPCSDAAPGCAWSTQSAPTKPRQPACAAATIGRWRCANKIGRQSATMMVAAKPTVCAMAMSASIAPASPDSGRSTCTASPCTCCKKAGFTPNVRQSRRLLAATATGSSPTWSPKFSVS